MYLFQQAKTLIVFFFLLCAVIANFNNITFFISGCFYKKICF